MRTVPDQDPSQATFEDDLITGLSRPEGKTIPSGWLYDDVGSALFEAITRLPEYGLTRADERVIARCAPHLPQHLGRDVLVAEMGSGTGRKTRIILKALAAEPGNGNPMVYAPIDVSAIALDACTREMETMPALTVRPALGTYLEGLKQALENRRHRQPVLLLFLGSTIGNFLRVEISEFLRAVRSQLQPGDFLLLGADLEKPAATLQLAYDDPTGVTASFNLNLLGHINRDLGADFQLKRFQHLAIYNKQERRIEMYLQATEAQEVWIELLNLRVVLYKGERVLTEYSHKFRLEELRGMAKGANFTMVEEWVDREWPFAECLWRAA